jgi:hypothetical protein
MPSTGGSTGTLGWYLSKTTGNLYANNGIFRGDITTAGQGKFNGQNSSSFSIAGYGSIYYSAFGLTPTSPPVSGVNNAGLLGVSSAVGASVNIGVGGYAANNGIGVAGQGDVNGVYGYGGTYGGYFSGSSYGAYSVNPFGTASNALVTNLYAQYSFNLKRQGSGSGDLYFYTGPTTGASIATFNATNKPGATNSTNQWIEVVINGASYQIPIWAS